MPKTNSVAGLLIFDTDSAGLVTRASVPAAGVNGASLDVTTLVYAIGCEIFDSSNGFTYRNVGTVAAPVWAQSFGNMLIQYQQTAISAANIIGTAAGQLGHANGVLLTPVAPTGFINILLDAVMSYTFAVAAYTAGGNITLNIGGGGAALTGLVSAANGVGKASSNVQQFEMLAAAADALTSAQSINLVSSVAFTNPGTAAGTVKVHCWYAQVPL